MCERNTPNETPKPNKRHSLTTKAKQNSSNPKRATAFISPPLTSILQFSPYATRLPSKHWLVLESTSFAMTVCVCWLAGWLLLVALLCWPMCLATACVCASGARAACLRHNSICIQKRQKFHKPDGSTFYLGELVNLASGCLSGDQPASPGRR